MSYFQSIMYAESPSRAEEAYLNAIGYIGSKLPTYPLWSDYLIKVYLRKELWCLAFRDQSMKGHNTNNFSEVAIRIFKDDVLSRVRAYNVITLIDFCATSLEKYYSIRLQEFTNSRNAGPRLFLEKMKKKVLLSDNAIKPEEVTKITAYQFSVKSGDIHLVDSLSGCCTCSEGRLGKFCKHQFAVYFYHNVCGQNFPAIGAKEKYKIACLALGQKAPPLEFYQPFLLDEIPQVDQSSEIITPSTSQAFVTMESNCLTVPNCHKSMLKEQLKVAFEDVLEKFDPSEAALAKALSHLKKLSSEGQCETMLATLGSNVPLKKKSGAAIRVQPTSIARRAVGVTRGSKRLARGRPSTGIQVPKKRKHNLSANVKLNQPNAKKH